MTMTPDDLRALADALEPMAKAPRFEDFDVPAFCAWVRACADAQPVAWMHDGFMSTDYERVQHDEMRNRSCGFKAKPIIPLYAHPAPNEPQAEPKREPLPDHEIVTMYAECPRSDAEMIDFARAVERAHGIGGSDEHQ